MLQTLERERENILVSFCHTNTLVQCNGVTFDGTLYKHVDGVAVGSPVGSSLANAFLLYHQRKLARKLSTPI